MKVPKKTLLFAHSAAALAALSAGVAVVATRYVVPESDPISLVFYRYLIATIGLLPLLWFLRPPIRLRVTDYGQIALLGILFFVLFPWAFNASLELNPAGRGAVGLASIPIQTLAVAVLFGREQLTPGKVVGVLLAFAGMIVAFGISVTGNIDGSLRGDFLMLLGVLCAAVYSVFSRPTLMRFGPLFVTTLAMLFAVLSLIPILLAQNGGIQAPTFSYHGWIAVVCLGTIGGSVQFSLFMWALRWLPPTTTVLYITLNPITAMALGIAFLGEALSGALVAGMAMVIVGVLIGTGVMALRTTSKESDPS